MQNGRLFAAFGAVWADYSYFCQGRWGGGGGGLHILRFSSHSAALTAAAACELGGRGGSDRPGPGTRAGGSSWGGVVSSLSPKVGNNCLYESDTVNHPRSVQKGLRNTEEVPVLESLDPPRAGTSSCRAGGGGGGSDSRGVTAAVRVAAGRPDSRGVAAGGGCR